MEFDAFDLEPALLHGIRDMGYTTATPIQEKAIPVVLAGRDVFGVSQTGTGKTAAYLLPILHRLIPGPSPVTRCLILAPTRELATQIDDNRVGLSYHTRLSGVCVYGGADMRSQERALKAGADIVTATPGRLLDHLWRGLPKLDRVEVLVLDEADRMLDMGFLPDIEKILRRLPEKRQNLLFSATMPPEIDRLAREMMHDPVSITVGPKARPVELVHQELVAVPSARKTRLLIDLLRDERMEMVLVFSRTKLGADRINSDLRRAGVPCTVIHSNRSQAERFEALEKFRHGQYRVLVATDIAARGIDVDGISHVVNFDVPHSPEDYVHRIGRTARAGGSGHAITFVAPEDERMIGVIERSIRMKLERRGGRAPEREHETPRTDERSSGRNGRDAGHRFDDARGRRRRGGGGRGGNPR